MIRYLIVALMIAALRAPSANLFAQPAPQTSFKAGSAVSVSALPTAGSPPIDSSFTRTRLFPYLLYRPPPPPLQFRRQVLPPVVTYAARPDRSTANPIVPIPVFEEPRSGLTTALPGWYVSEKLQATSPPTGTTSLYPLAHVPPIFIPEAPPVVGPSYAFLFRFERERGSRSK